MVWLAMRLRLAGACLVLAVVAIVILAFAQFKGDFSSTSAVTVTAQRAGLVLDPDAKVKLRGVEIGRVASIGRAAPRDGKEQARLTLALTPDSLRLVPANVRVDIASTTVFGAKYVNFVLPPDPSPARLAPGATLEAGSVTVEYNTLFEHLSDVLDKVEPQKLNATLSAIASALHGRGGQLGDLLGRSDTYLATMNPSLPALQRDFAKAAEVTQLYADTAGDLLRTVSNATVTSDSIVAEQQNLDAVLLGVIGLDDTAGGVLRHNERNLGTALELLRPTTGLLNRYSPALTCLINGMGKALPLGEQVFGGGQPGVALNTGFTYGAPAYTLPKDLPKVNAKGGPNCWGLPNPPMSPDAPHAPFVVTDTANVPYAPSSQLGVGPNIFQLLYGDLLPKAGGGR